MSNVSISRIVFQAFFLLIPIALPAQSFRQIIDDFKTTYQNVENFRIHMHVSAYENEKDKKPFYDDEIDIKRKGNNVLQQAKSQEMLMNDQYLVVVNKASKEIMVTTRNPKAEQMAGKMNLPMDSVFSMLGDPSFVERTGDVDHYVLKRESDMISEIHFYLNMTKHQVQQLTYKYANGQVADIKFGEFNIHPQFDPGEFDEEKYVIIEGKTVRTAAAFNRYSIL